MTGPLDLCRNCRNRAPAEDSQFCRCCIANAAVARKRRANARVRALAETAQKMEAPCRRFSPD